MDVLAFPLFRKKNTNLKTQNQQFQNCLNTTLYTQKATAFKCDKLI